MNKIEIFNIFKFECLLYFTEMRKFLSVKNFKLIQSVGTSNHMFRKKIWDKLSECIFKNFEIARVK